MATAKKSKRLITFVRIPHKMAVEEDEKEIPQEEELVEETEAVDEEEKDDIEQEED